MNDIITSIEWGLIVCATVGTLAALVYAIATGRGYSRDSENQGRGER